MTLGFSILAGPNAKSDPDFTHIAFLPRMVFPLHKNWDFEFEGNLSYYSINEGKNLYLLGANGNVLFKPFRWKMVTPFLLGGGGLAYNNGNGQVRTIGKSHVAGILQGGVGVDYRLEKGWALRGEYCYHHISDPFNRDRGLNTHGFILGASF
jgi:opacity protein-like surface antigen